MHRNNLKPYVLPSDTGAMHYPIPESEGTAMLFENDPANTEGERRPTTETEALPPEQARSARLRQNMYPPLRFGEFAAH